MLEKNFRVVTAADHCIGIGEPETANEKSSFLTGEPVFGFPNAIAQHESIFHQVAFNGFYRSPKAGIVRWQKSYLGH